jgi:tRNA pseudouridine13 synthase
MKHTSHPLEQDLGLHWYISDTPPIGGVLKQSAEDFIVDEIPIPESFGTTGKHLICRLTKKNWESHRAIKEIAKKLRISHRRFGWAGTKDRRAVTTQYISIYEIPAERIGEVKLKDIRLEAVGRSDSPLHLGELLGNRFEITIKKCFPEELEKRVDAVSATVSAGLPNYFGIQRFGALRPVTHLVGKALLQGEFEEAVALYIGMTSTSEPVHTITARETYYRTRNIREALHEIPVQLSYERAMLHHLSDRKDDFRGAFGAIPPKLLSMFISAYQSYLFNRTLSHRLELGHSLFEPVPGDRLLFRNGKEDVVTDRNLQTAAVHIRRGACTIALFMPGGEVPTAHGPMDHYTLALMEEDGISHESFAAIGDLVHNTRFSGALRQIVLRSDIQAAVGDTEVQLEFCLLPGQYATTVCREYMKADPASMV